MDAGVKRTVFWGMGLILIMAANGLIMWRQGAPLLFPLLALPALAASLRWGWQGMVGGGLGGSVVALGLGWLAPCVPLELAIGAALVTLGWAIVLGCLGRWLQNRALGAPGAGELATPAPNEV